MSMPAVFLDLNGTLVSPVQVNAPEEFTPIPGSVEAVRLLNEAGFLCPVVTVQSRIAKGIYTEEAFRAWFSAFQQHIAAEGAHLMGPYLCPHRFDAGCACAKPKPTLYRQAAADFDIDVQRSYVIGDTVSDIQAAVTIGARGCLVRTGWGEQAVAEVQDMVAYVGPDIAAAANWIVTRTNS